jgi:hypothetical protein
MIMIIVIIMKTVLFSNDVCQMCLKLNHFLFTSLDFTTVIFYRAKSSALRPTPNLEDQSLAFISPSNKVAQLYPQALGSLFVAFYDSQGYGGGILTCLHVRKKGKVVPVLN